MDDSIADQLGLVPTHAYAILKVERVGNMKFLQLKNPYVSHIFLNFE